MDDKTTSSRNEKYSDILDNTFKLFPKSFGKY